MIRSAVIGSGGAGRNMLSMLSGSGIPLYLMDSTKDPEYGDIFSMKSEIIASISTDPKIKRSLMTTERGALHILNSYDLVFSVSGLGGFYGTAVPVMLSKLSGNTIPFVAVPFSVEGEARRKQASYGLKKLLKSSPWVLALENDRLLEIAPNATIQGAFRAINMIFAESISRIGKSFDVVDDIITALKGRVGVGMGEGEGMNRAEKAFRDAFRSPWLRPDKNIILVMKGGSRDDFLWVRAAMEDRGLDVTLENHDPAGERIELLVVG